MTKRITNRCALWAMLSLLMVQNVQAQSKVSHSINVWALGGYAAMLDNMDNVQTNFGGGGGLGIGYELTAKRFMAGIGVEGVYAATKNTLDAFNNEEARIDKNGDAVTYRYVYSDYVEKKTLIDAAVPVYVGLHLSKYLYAQLGCKVGFLVNTDYHTTAQMLTEGEYARFVQPFRSVPSYGYYDETEYSGSGNLSLGLNLAGTFEIGADLPLKGKKTDMRIGAFCDYGISNLNTKDNLSLVDYTNVDANPSTLSQENLANNIRFNSIMSAQEADGKRFNTLLIGLKVCLKFNLIGNPPCRCDY